MSTSHDVDSVADDLHLSEVDDCVSPVVTHSKLIPQGSNDGSVASVTGASATSKHSFNSAMCYMIGGACHGVKASVDTSHHNPLSNSSINTSSSVGSVAMDIASASPITTMTDDSFRPVLSKTQRRRRNRLQRNQSGVANLSSNYSASPKRGRSQNSSFNDPQPVIKKIKSTERKINPTVITPLQVAIVNSSSTKGTINIKEMCAIRAALNRLLDDMDLSLTLPRFNNFYINNFGFLFVNCVDCLSLEWLTESVAGLKLWEGCSLKVVNRSDLPKPIKALLLIPGEVEDPAIVIKRLSRHNPGLNASEWRILGPSIKSDPPGQTIPVFLDDNSHKYIAILDHRLYYGVDRIRVIFPELENSSEREKNAVEPLQPSTTA